MFAAGVAILAVCVLGQIPAVLYLSRYFERDDGEAPPVARFWAADDPTPADRSTARPPRPGDRSGTVASTTPVGGPPPARCRECGSTNDRAYTFCRRCLTRLA